MNKRQLLAAIFAAVGILLLVMPVAPVPLQLVIIFNDGFESGDFSAWDSHSPSGNPTILSVVTTNPREGTYHADCHTDASTNWAFVTKVLSSELIVSHSCYYYFLELPSAGTAWLTEMRGISTDSIADVRIIGGATSRLAVEYLSGTGLVYQYGTTILSINTWYLIELYLKIADGTGEIQLKLDGVPEVTLTNLDNDARGGVDWVRFGLRQSGPLHCYIDVCSIALEGVIENPPVPTVSPSSVAITEGQTATFICTVTGGYLPFTYDWYFDDVLTTETSNSYISASSLTEGTYEVYCDVTDSTDTTTKSNVATLTVNPPGVETSTITVSSSLGGHTEPAEDSYTYTKGENFTITAIADVGYNFSYLFLNSVSEITDNPYTFTVIEDSYIFAAIFENATTGEKEEPPELLPGEQPPAPTLTPPILPPVELQDIAVMQWMGIGLLITSGVMLIPVRRGKKHES